MTANCRICGGPDRAGHVPAPQESIAASLCWLTNLHGGLHAPTPVAERMTQRRRHPNGGCRYCGMLAPAKLEVVNRGLAHQATDPRWIAWEQLAANRQFARVCEAQEVTWIDSLPAEA